MRGIEHILSTTADGDGDYTPISTCSLRHLDGHAPTPTSLPLAAVPYEAQADRRLSH